MAVQDVVDRERCRTQLVDQHDPAQVLRGEQSETFGARQLLPTNLTHGLHLLGVHTMSPVAGPVLSAASGHADSARLATHDRVTFRTLCRASTPVSPAVAGKRRSHGLISSGPLACVRPSRGK